MTDYSLFVLGSYLVTFCIMLTMLAKSALKYFDLQKKYYQKIYGKKDKP
jgi:hypothetical protein